MTNDAVKNTVRGQFIKGLRPQLRKVIETARPECVAMQEDLLILVITRAEANLQRQKVMYVAKVRRETEKREDEQRIDMIVGRLAISLESAGLPASRGLTSPSERIMKVNRDSTNLCQPIPSGWCDTARLGSSLERRRKCLKS